METYDLAVIGAGAAGLAAAQTGVALGKRTVIIERDRLGGECTWNGCVPSKALIEAARLCHDLTAARRFGIGAGPVRVDFPAVMAHVQDVIATIASFEDEDHLQKAGIAVRRGNATITGATTVTVDGEVLGADRIAVCTGSRPAVPPIEGLDKVPHLTNENLFDLSALPRQLIVIGAGPIGLEMAQAFRRLGSDVEVVDVVDTLLPREDPQVASLARQLLEDEGVKFSLGVQVRAVVRAQKEYRVTLSSGAAGSHGDESTSAGRQSAERELIGDAVLVATGRRPRVEDLGLETVGVKIERRGVAVDEHCRTSVETIYAAGDVTGLLPFTHAAAYQGRIAASNALGSRSKADYRVVPWVTFTDPEIAHLGLTEPEARKEHGEIEVACLPYTAIDRAVIQRQVRGLIKVIAKGKPVIGTRFGGGEIVGAHIVGPNASDLIHEFADIMQTRSFTGRLAQTIHAYPTMSLGVQQAVAQLFPLGRATSGDLRESLAEREEFSGSRDAAPSS